MGYQQLSIEERCKIALLGTEGASVREAARRLDRAPSTVAHDRAWGHHLRGHRLERYQDLRVDVLRRLRRGCSPEQVAGQSAWEEGRTAISYESIYRFVYGRSTRGMDYDSRRYLPRGKWKAEEVGPQGGKLGLLHRPPKTDR